MKKQIPQFTNLRPRILGNPERNSQPSMTQPEQITPLERLLLHRGTGVPVPYFNGVFSEQDTPDIQKLDFVGIAELLEATQENITLAKDDIHALNKRHEELVLAARQQQQEEYEKRRKIAESVSE